MRRWTVRGRLIEPGDRPLIMGIVNVTPDSFFDGGQFAALDDAVNHGCQLVADGADLLDIGGESSRPGSKSVSVEVEVARVIPLLNQLRALVSVPISIDTTKFEVARLAIDAGADVINDISGLADPRMLALVTANSVGAVIMHKRGEPRTMQHAPAYDDVVQEVWGYLSDRVEAARQAGVGREQIAIDPGIGFGKTLDHNCLLLRNLRHFDEIGCPLLVGTSRKGFLGTITGRSTEDRLVASVASALACVANGATVVRVHDVAAVRDALLVWQAQTG